MSNDNTVRHHLVILGIDTDKKPHAAVFSAADEPVVRNAAEAMGMRLYAAVGDKARAMARKLPEGKLFATGKALVPLVKRAIYDELEKLLTPCPPEKPADAIKSGTGQASQGSKASPDGAKPPTKGPWTEIKVGSVVLCREEGDEGGWWESVVMTIGADGESMIMRWRDYPKLKSFPAKRHAVGLLGSAAPVKPTRN